MSLEQMEQAYIRRRNYAAQYGAYGGLQRQLVRWSTAAVR